MHRIFEGEHQAVEAMKRTGWRRSASKGLKFARRRVKSRESVSSLKKRLDAVFSQFIRRKYADRNGYVSCFTCGVQMHWKKIQNGHYISRSHNATRYSIKNNHPQCVGCNVFKHGNMPAYALALLKKYGPDILEELSREKQKIKQFSIPELKAMIAEFSLSTWEGQKHLAQDSVL